MEANNHKRKAVGSCSPRNRNRRSLGGPRVRLPRLPAAWPQPLALSLIVMMWWLVLQVPTAWGQVSRAAVPPVPDAIDAHNTAEDGANVVVSDGVDDILALADEPLENLARQDVVVPAMDMEVTSVARQESTVGRSPAAVFVITGEMIRRSGARSIPEALRLAPGVNVARVTSSRWAVSIRGFNETYANKLLVQIDNRTVYTPVFSGVYWDQQDVLLEDVDRIEVIRGPGATVWGANAVNGIINIITKRARDTQGLFVQGGGGTEERGFGAFRYGGTAGESLNYRIYGLGFERDEGFSTRDASDDWRKQQIGFRVDWEPCDCSALTIQGDFYRGESERRFDGALPNPPFFTFGVHEVDEPSGSNLLLRWSRKLDEKSDWAIQLYYDRVERPSRFTGFADGYTTFDLDFQHRFPIESCHSLIWGLGYRHTRSDTEGSYIVSFDPADRSFGLISFFVQDEIVLSPDRLHLTLGSKFEHNDFSGFEFQPTARLLWTPSERQSIWASISRAVRTPSRVDEDFRLVSYPVAFSFAPPGVTFSTVHGNPTVDAEQLLAFEIGARAQPSDDFWWDLAVFANRYDDLIIRLPATPVPPPPAMPPALWPKIATNVMRGESYGFEVAATYRVNPRWNLSGGYSFLKTHLHAPPGAPSSAEDGEGMSPQNQAYLQTSWDLGRSVELDVIGRYVDHLPALGIPSYVAMDVRLAWLPTETVEMAVVGRHLLDRSHPEFSGAGFYSSEVEQEVFGIVTLRY